MKKLLVYLVIMWVACFLGLSACSKGDSGENQTETTNSQTTQRKSLKDPINKAHGVRAMEEERADAAKESLKE
jgi:hypothetical protein